MDSITEEKMVMLTKYIIAKSLDTQKKTTKTKIHEIETQDKFTKDLFNRLFHKLMIPIVNASGEREYFIEFLVNFINP